MSAIHDQLADLNIQRVRLGSARLSRRELQVIDLMRQGCTNKEIASRLGITYGTVKVYASRIYGKTPEVRNRYDAVKVCARDQERLMAIRLNEWIKTHAEGLSATALAELKLIMADMVAKVLQ